MKKIKNFCKEYPNVVLSRMRNLNLLKWRTENGNKKRIRTGEYSSH